MSLSFIRSLRDLARPGESLPGSRDGRGAPLRPSDLLLDLRDAAASGGAAEELFDPAPTDLLAEAVEIGRSLHGVRHFGDALDLVGRRLSPLLGAQAVVRLRVQGCDAQGFLVRPWSEGDTRQQEWINLNQLAVVPPDDVPLGAALTRARPWSGMPAAVEPSWPWREAAVQGVLCLPVALDGLVVAVLEWQQVQRATPALLQTLELISLQLSDVLRREALPAHRLAALAWMQFAGQPAAGGAAEPAGSPLSTLLIPPVAPASAPSGATAAAGLPGHASPWIGPLFAALLETIPISLMVLDANDFSIVSFNHHAQAEFGVDRLGGPGRSIEDVLGTDVALQLLPLTEQAIVQPHAIEDEFSWLTTHGQRHVLAWQAAVRDNNGDAMFVLCQLRDITTQKQEEIKQIETELRFKELIESIDGGVFVTTPMRDHYAYMGARVLEIFGVRADEFRADADCLRRRVLPEDLPLLDSHRASEESVRQSDVSFRITHPVTGLRWLRQRTRARELSNGEVRVYGLVDDVTDEREREQLLHQARDSAEAASQAKSQFLANMSHEIRTPMNGILGMTEILLGTALSEQQKRCAQAVYSSGESLLEIIDDILDFAKIEAGRLELAPTDFDLRVVVEDTLELLAQRAHQKGLELSFREADPLPLMVHADPLRLRQVLTNLVANAIKFTEHGEVVVELRLASPDVDAAGAEGGSEGEGGGEGGGEGPAVAPQRLRFECVVRDTGIGIAPEAMPRLFSAFTQVHGGMSRRYGGTGLGLAISRQLVELMGGTVSVESRPGVGSEFRFTFDALACGASESSLADRMAMPTLRVLVVEDNQTSRTVLENLLGAWGLKVTVAVDGLHALEILREIHPEDPGFDLALVDWRMPQMDGIAFARAVRAEGLQPQMRLLLLSSVSAPEDVRTAQEAGYRRFIHKPVRKGELRAALLGMTGGGSGAEDAAIQLDLDVLVVEDNAVNREVMGQMLQRLGCRAHMAGSALEGLEALGQREHDLVLMDIQMPGMDGLEALDWIRRGGRERFPLRCAADIPVVAVTANAMAGDEERFLAHGFDAYLSKPYRQGQLHEVLLACPVRRPLGSAGAEARVGPPRLPGAASPGAAGNGAGRVSPGSPAGAVLRQGGDAGRAAATMAGANSDGLTLLDPQALAQLRLLDPTGENELMPRVLKAFDASLEALTQALDASAATADAQGLRHVVHTLKSSAASVGATELARLCSQAESELRQGEVQGVFDRRVRPIRQAMAAAHHGVVQALHAGAGT